MLIDQPIKSPRKVQLDVGMGPAGDIYHRPAERLIERAHGRPPSPNTFACAECPGRRKKSKARTEKVGNSCETYEKGRKRRRKHSLKSGDSRFDSRFSMSERRLIIYAVRRHTRELPTTNWYQSSQRHGDESIRSRWLSLIAAVGLIIHKSCCCYCAAFSGGRGIGV